MARRLEALALFGALTALTQSAAALSPMCTEPSFASAQEQREAQAIVPTPLREEDLPWCASAEDPRCAPLHGDTGSLAIGIRQATAVAADAVVPRRAPVGDERFTPNLGLHPHAGVASRIERPPRAGR